MRSWTIFGREPALMLAVISGALALLVTFQFDWLTAEQSALWVAAINAGFGIFTAMAVRPIPPTAFTYGVTAGAALLAAYGLDWGQETIGAVNVFILAVLALVTRAQSTPKIDPRPIP